MRGEACIPCSVCLRALFSRINSWLNRTVGIGRVEDATIEQLDTSIGLLLDELSGASARR